MHQYGYKLSGMARGEKYLEAEAFLDKKLEGFEKPPASFEEDGSRTQKYRRNNADGTVCEVTLVRNVTESGLLVFSDIPLKYFRFGGAVLYLRDIIPSLIYALVFWVGERLLLQQITYHVLVRIIAAIIGGVITCILCILTDRLLDKNRSYVRRKFIQLGGVFSVICLIYYAVVPYFNWSLDLFLNEVFYTPIPTFIFGIVFILEFGRKNGR